MRRFSHHRMVILLILMSIVACRPPPPAPDVVADTDLGMIRSSALDEFILSQPEQRRSPPGGQSLPEWRRRMLEELIVARALESEAQTKDLAETMEGGSYLASRTEPVLTQTMATRLIEARINITDEDLRSFYDAHPEDFSHPEQIRVRNIYRRVARNAPPEVWETARQDTEALLDEIRRGARFGDLARAHSDSETAQLEGLIGRLDRGKMKPELEEILWSLDEGEVSEVIRTPVGFQIFKVETHLGRFKMDFEDARTRLRRRLTREATEAAEEAILHELIEASGATYQPGKLKDGNPEEIIFNVGDDSLTVADFYGHLNSIGFFTAREVDLHQQLDNAVRDRLYLWQAEATNLADEPAMAIRLDQLERDAMIALAIRTRGRAMIDTLDEKDLRDFYESRKARFQTPRLLHLRILTRDFPIDGRWYAVYEELERLAGEIRAGRREFDQAARELSTDFSGARGGDVGAIRPDALSEWAGPQAQRQVLELAPGEISEPILIEHYNTNRLTYQRAGYMLVQLTSVEDPRTRSFEEVRDIVVERYLESHSAEILERTRQEILRSVRAEIYPENL